MTHTLPRAGCLYAVLVAAHALRHWCMASMVTRMKFSHCPLSPSHAYAPARPSQHLRCTTRRALFATTRATTELTGILCQTGSEGLSAPQHCCALTPRSTPSAALPHHQRLPPYRHSTGTTLPTAVVRRQHTCPRLVTRDFFTCGGTVSPALLAMPGLPAGYRVARMSWWRRVFGENCSWHCSFWTVFAPTRPRTGGRNCTAFAWRNCGLDTARAQLTTSAKTQHRLCAARHSRSSVALLATRFRFLWNPMAPDACSLLTVPPPPYLTPPPAPSTHFFHSSPPAPHSCAYHHHAPYPHHHPTTCRLCHRL